MLEPPCIYGRKIGCCTIECQHKIGRLADGHLRVPRSHCRPDACRFYRARQTNFHRDVQDAQDTTKATRT